MDDSPTPRWLLLIHQIPPQPNYFRVKVGRRLQRVGAVALKNSVYVLPRTEACREDLQWIVQEIVKEGGDATLCEATLLDGLRDDQMEALFTTARDVDYGEIAEEIRRLAVAWPEGIDAGQRASLDADLARLRRKVADIAALDFFGAPGRVTVEGLLSGLETRLRALDKPAEELEPPVPSYRGRTWVTRTGVHIDRIASAWLVRRFIDPEARFSFVAPKGYAPGPEELRFDMFEAEFTHVGERCTFEVLIERMRLSEPALTPIAEIVHDIDLKEQRFNRPETQGIATLIAGIAMAHRQDEARIARGSAIFDDLLEFFRRKGS